MRYKIKRLNQKEFTKQDKKVYQELYKATNGFRQVPKGWRGLTARDGQRATGVFYGIDKALIDKNPKIARKLSQSGAYQTLMKHLDLPETAKGGGHLLAKLSNPELLDRYLRLKQYKQEVSGINKKINFLKNLRDRSEKLYYRVDPGSETGLRSFLLRERVQKKLRGLNSEKYKATGIDRLIAQRKTARKSLEYASQKNTRLSNLAIKEEKLKQKALEQASKRGINIVSDSSVNPGEAFIEHGFETGYKSIHYPKTGVDPYTLQHELGHDRFYDHVSDVFQLNRDKKYKTNAEAVYKGLYERFNDDDSLYKLGDEFGASLAGISRLKKDGATPEQLEHAKRQLKSAYETYLISDLQGLRQRLTRRLINE